MAIKKSDLYSSLWQSCDELRGGMDASQYKGYVLFMRFINYVSDKYGDSDDFAPPVNIPKGARFIMPGLRAVLFEPVRPGYSAFRNPKSNPPCSPTPLPQFTDEVATLAARVDKHLKKMGHSSVSY